MHLGPSPLELCCINNQHNYEGLGENQRIILHVRTWFLTLPLLKNGSRAPVTRSKCKWQKLLTSTVSAVGESYRSSSEAGVSLQCTQAWVCLPVAATDDVRRRRASTLRSTVDAMRRSVLILHAMLSTRTCHVRARIWQNLNNRRRVSIKLHLKKDGRTDGRTSVS